FWETREAPVWAQHMFQRQGLAVQEHKRATMHYNLGLGKPTCRPRAARRTPRPVGGRDACKLPWEGSLWKGVRPGPKRASEGLKPEGEHRTIVRMTRVASSRGRDRRAAAARKSGARPRRRGGAHGGCERAASAPVRESAGGPVGRAGRRSEEHEEREERGETGEDEEEHDSLLQRALRLLTPGGGSAGGKTGFFSRTAGREIGRKMAPDLTLNTVGDAPVVRHHQFLRPGSAHMHKSV
ncbi:unnamed protein product, partial [Prorocentrum cordatum]